MVLVTGTDPRGCLRLAATSLCGVIRKSPATAKGYSQQAELTGSATTEGGFGSSVALSAGGSTALVGDFEHDKDAGAGYVFAPGRRARAWITVVICTQLPPG